MSRRDKPRKPDKPDDPKLIFAYGEAYRHAAAYLDVAPEPKWRFYFPSWVCIALATELYFKALITLETGQNARKDHNLSRLFRCFSRPRQLRMRQLFDEQGNNNPTFKEQYEKFRAILNTRGVTTQPRTFEAALDASSKGFEQLRYGYRPDPGGFQWFGADICNAIFAVVAEIHPEWVNQVPLGPPTEIIELK